jgi:hypothetical protein
LCPGTSSWRLSRRRDVEKGNGARARESVGSLRHRRIHRWMDLGEEENRGWRRRCDSAIQSVDQPILGKLIKLAWVTPKMMETGGPDEKTGLNLGEPLDWKFHHLPTRFRHIFACFRLNLGNLCA